MFLMNRIRWPIARAAAISLTVDIAIKTSFNYAARKVGVTFKVKPLSIVLAPSLKLSTQISGPKIPEATVQRNHPVTLVQSPPEAVKVVWI
jgi:hypothetical protein